MSRVNNRTKKKIYRRSRGVIFRRKKKQKTEKKILKGGDGEGEDEIETKVLYYEGLEISPEEHLELDGWTRKNDNDNSWYVDGTDISVKNIYEIVSKEMPKYEETMKDKLKRFEQNNLIHPVLEAAVAVARATAELKFLCMIKKKKEKQQEEIIKNQNNKIKEKKETYSIKRQFMEDALNEQTKDMGHF